MYDGNDTALVCKTFYLTTLGFNAKNDFFVNKALSSVNEGSIAPKKDGRGKACNPRKIDRDHQDPH